jgi:hypothetical protein
MKHIKGDAILQELRLERYCATNVISLCPANELNAMGGIPKPTAAMLKMLLQNSEQEGNVACKSTTVRKRHIYSHISQGCQ